MKHSHQLKLKLIYYIQIKQYLFYKYELNLKSLICLKNNNNIMK